MSEWNVAIKEPKKSHKVGGSGIHRMVRTSDFKVLLAMKSGAVAVYDIVKRSIEFTTEAGHSETIFETEFCKSNCNYLASCSYDGTVRIWDTKTMTLVCINDTARGTV